jgi:selenocysteine-specific elongation factor
MRTAINLPDLSIDENGVKRGDLITVHDIGNAHPTMDVLLERSARLNRNTPAARPIKSGSSVHFHFGTSRTVAKIVLLNVAVLEAGQRAVAQLRLDLPILVFVGDRFVLRDSSERNTIAGGTVLDPDADHANFRSAGQMQFLRARAAAPHDVQLCVGSQLARDGFAECKSLLTKSNFSADEIADALSRLRNRAGIVLSGEIAADQRYWHELITRAAELIDLAHQKNPERRGLDLSELRRDLKVGSEKLFTAIVSQLNGNGFTRFENTIARACHRPALPPELLLAAEKLRAALSEKPFDPPDRKILCEDRHLQQALRFLIEQGELMELNGEIVLLSDAAEQMRNAVVEFLSVSGSATASQLRQRIGTTRRVIIPFLEYLDRHGVTQRVGDQRVLAKKSAAAKLIDAATAQRS